jgi:hypothetical protein
MSEGQPKSEYTRRQFMRGLVVTTLGSGLALDGGVQLINDIKSIVNQPNEAERQVQDQWKTPSPKEISEEAKGATGADVVNDVLVTGFGISAAEFGIKIMKEHK